MKIIETEKPYIYDLRKNIYEGTIHLDWKSIECTDYLIINTTVINKEKVIISDESTLHNLISLINENKEALISRKFYMSNNINMQLISHTTLRKKGGIPVGNTPGFYIIYGIKFIGIDDFDIYLYPNSYEENSIRLSVDVNISVSPYCIDKKNILSLGTKKIYSGYKRITLDKRIGSLKCGDLTYKIQNKVFPLPAEVLNDTSVFYVKANENDTIEFDTKIKEIIIKES